MYHCSIGIKYTARKSISPSAYGCRFGPITFKLYDSPRLRYKVDFTCTRICSPRYSTPTSYRADPLNGRETNNPSRAARAIKHSSAQSP